MLKLLGQRVVTCIQAHSKHRLWQENWRNKRLPKCSPLTMEVLEHAQMECELPTVFFLKKDRPIHFHVDHRKFKAMKIRGSYPVTCIKDCINSLFKDTIYPTMDNNSGYGQVGIAQDDGEKTAFTSHHGFPVSQECLWIRKTPLGRSNKGWRCYFESQVAFRLAILDANVILLPTMDEDSDHARQGLKRWHDAGITSGLKICQFYPNCSSYLDNVIHPGCLKVS